MLLVPSEVQRCNLISSFNVVRRGGGEGDKGTKGKKKGGKEKQGKRKIRKRV